MSWLLCRGLLFEGKSKQRVDNPKSSGLSHVIAPNEMRTGLFKGTEAGSLQPFACGGESWIKASEV